MKATYWQRGESLDYKNNTTAVIEENTIISIATRIGVAGTAIEPGQTGSLHVTGVFEIAKAEGEAITMGTAVYFDGSAITATADGNTPAGYAAQDAAESASAVLVKLLG